MSEDELGKVDWTPRRKVAAGGIAGAVVTVVLALTGWDPKPEVVAALTTLVSTALAYVVRD